MANQRESRGNMPTQPQTSTFPQFTRLPPELRRTIWLFAARIPRTIEVYQRSLYIDKLRRMFNMCGKTYLQFLCHATPAILSASRESRYTALDVFTKLDFDIYETSIRTPIAIRQSMYVNLDLDVLFLHDYPRTSNLHQIKNLFVTKYAPFRRMRYDTRWRDCDGPYYDASSVAIRLSDMPSLKLYQKGLVRAILKAMWYYCSTMEILELVVDEDPDSQITVDIVRDAVEEYFGDAASQVEVKFVRLPEHISMQDSDPHLSATTASLPLWETFREANVYKSLIRLRFSSEIRDKMAADVDA